MWFNSGIKDKYIVSYTTEVFFSEDVLINKFGILVFKAINSNETYVNGKLIGKKGFVSKDKLKIESNASPSLYRIPDGYLQKGKNQISIRVADSAASGGFLEAPRICEISVCEKSYNRFMLLTGGTGLFLLFIGIYHLLLYFGNNKEKPILYFGVGTIAQALIFSGYERVIYLLSEKFLVHFYALNLGYCFSSIFTIFFIHSFLEKKISLLAKALLICFSFGVLSTLVAGISLDYRAIHSRYVLLITVMGFVPMVSFLVFYLTVMAIKEKKWAQLLFFLEL